MGKFESLDSRMSDNNKSTKSQINLNIELKRQNSRENRSITFHKDSALVSGEARQISKHQLKSDNHADQHVTFDRS